MARSLSNKLIWIDCEFNSLDFNKNVMLEIAVVVTDADLNILDDGLEYVISQPSTELNASNEWVKENLGDLIEKSRYYGTQIKKAESAILEYLEVAHGITAESAPLCGNSVGQDRRVLYRQMPRLEKFLHYRNIDVSTMKELLLRWKPDMTPYPKKQVHRALEDIRESVGEMKYFKDQLGL